MARKSKLKPGQETSTLQLLADIINLVSEEESFELALQYCLNLICLNLNWQIGHVYLPDSKDEKILIPSDIWYFENPVKSREFYKFVMQTPVVFGQILSGAIWAAGKPIWIEDLQTKSSREEYPKMKIHAAIGFPVRLEKKTVAVFEFYSYEKKHQDNEMLFTLSVISQQISHIFKQREAKKILQDSEERFSQAFNNAAIGMALVGLDGSWLKVNDALCRLTGYSSEELLELDSQTITHPEDLKTYLNYIEKLVDMKISNYHLKKRYIRKDGTIIWILLSVSLVSDKETQEPLYFVAQIQDINQQKIAEEKLRHQATHDSLTGLANRVLLDFALLKTLASARRHGKLVAVLLLDLDSFKKINDEFGHDAGDNLLKIVSERLQNSMRASDTLARLGGDEFVIVQTEISDKESIIYFLEKIRKVLAIPVKFKNQVFIPTASIGISVYPIDGVKPQTLIKKADKALYAVKKKGGDNYHFFSENWKIKAKIKTKWS